MGRLKLDIVVLTIALVLVNCVVQSQYFVHRPPRPLYYVQDGPPSDEQLSQGSDELIDIQEAQNRQFQSRKGVPQAPAVESEEDEDEEEDESSMERQPPNGRARPVHLPPGFDESVKRKMQVAKRPKRPLHGDPSPIHQDEDEESRRPESRLLWPFSIEITKGGDKGGGGWGSGPSHYGSHHHHGGGGHGGGGHHGHGGGHHGGGHHGHHGHHHHKGHHKFQIHAGHRHDHGSHDGWGWDAYIEHEKHKLKYEILKLKAKKKIAVLQNKVELKKLLSMLLQKKIQALEWWR